MMPCCRKIDRSQKEWRNWNRRHTIQILYVQLLKVLVKQIPTVEKQKENKTVSAET